MERDPRIAEIDYEELKSKYLILQHERCCQQEIIGRQKMELLKLRSQLKNQAVLCSKTGSVLGYCLWKAAKTPEVINFILSGDKLYELSLIMVHVIASFKKNYHDVTPTSDTDETRFVTSLIGLVANLATVDAGRRFFALTNVGKNVVELIIHIVTRTPSPSGNTFKKIAYTALHNVGLFPIRSSQLLSPELISVLNDDIKDVNNTNIPPDLRIIVLKLLQLVIRNICNKRTYEMFKNNIEPNRITQLTSSVDKVTEMLARDILKDVANVEKRYETEIVMS